MVQAGALRFVILIGVVSLFADFTYEGARSITGPYLATLGASSLIIGSVAGFGELIGYCFRLLSGYLSDKTGRYWAITILGYVVNLAAVPLLALTSSWEVASLLIVAERFGKGIRTPARDTMISYAGQSIGRGRAFGIHQALDQAGAVIGPLLMSWVLAHQGSYANGFAILAVPAIFAVTILWVASRLFPEPHRMEDPSTLAADGKLTKAFWLYLAAASLVAFGFVDFALIAFHLHQTQTIPAVWIPVSYSCGMVASAASAFVLGHWFDRRGTGVILYAVAISILAVPLVFFGGFYTVLCGMACWGLGLGAQGTLMSAIVAQLVPGKKRGTAYGILYTAFGLSWFLGSALLGYLYAVSIPLLVLFSVLAQLVSIPFFLTARET